MITFLIALGVLIAGYIIYGSLAERVFGIDPKRRTPALEHADGVDFVVMPAWKVFLIQFLNIAGLGPIFGAIMGVMFGPAAFIWIAFGTIFAGGVHDYIAAMMSLRSRGASLPELVGNELGPKIKMVMRVFCVALLLLVTAVFVVSPAGILSSMFSPDSVWASSTFWIVLIFGYYMLATLLPVDKLIGKAYPVFGFTLLFMALGIMGFLIFGDASIPDGFAEGIYNRRADADMMPLFPMMFVSIACGAISGFHATQSPMMARCLKNERLAHPIFYGAMVAEGIVALIWAAAAIAFTGGYEELSEYMSTHSAGQLVQDISITWLGAVGGILAIIGVVAAPITTGDTALRSARIMTADMFGFEQRPVPKRLMVAIPLFIVAAIITVFASNPRQFEIVWRYFAWFNQTLAVFTLWAATAWLRREGRQYLLTLFPALFMTCVSVSFLLVAPAAQGGLGLLSGEYASYGIGIGGFAALMLMLLFYRRKRTLSA